MAVMLKVHIVSFECWRGFSAISNELLESHRLVFTSAKRISTDKGLILSLSVSLSYQKNYCLGRMEHFQNNNIATRQMNLNALTPQVRHSRTFVDKILSCNQDQW